MLSITLWRFTITAVVDNFKLNTFAKKYKELVEAHGSSHLVLPGNLISHSKINSQALQVIKRLVSSGYEAYLVGGCVRDLLLHKAPKDFDVVTNATPEQVKRLFSNSRIIGRRFKIVHVTFSNGIIEVATFRAKQDQEVLSTTSQEGMLLRDNIYGSSLEDDATRRDYTINALYYSPFENKIHDFHGGVYDILNGIIDIIGDPETRFREDPVRMIRAYRFAAKLDFSITPRTKDKINELLPLIKNVPPARMFEEFNKLFITGHGEKSFKLLFDNDVLKYLLADQGTLSKDPAIYKFIAYALQNSDERHKNGKRNMPHFLYSVMLWPLVYKLYTRMLTIPKHSLNHTNEEIMRKAAEIVLLKQGAITQLPMPAMKDITDIWAMVVSLENPDNLEHAQDFVWNGLYRAAQDFIALRGHFDPDIKNIYEKWLEAYEFIVPPSLRSRALLQKAKNKEEEHHKRDKKRRKSNDKSFRNRQIRRGKPKTRDAQVAYFGNK